jgi:elongation factor 1-gamma
MASAVLYTYPENFRSFRIQIAAKYSGTRLTVNDSPPKFVYGETNKSAEFLKKFPRGKVPAVEFSDGLALCGPTAAALHIASPALRGQTQQDQALILNWMEFADQDILPASCTWVFPCLGIMQFNKQNTEKAKEEVKHCLQILDDHLRLRTYLVGERISLADITVCCNLLQLYQHVLDAEFRKPYVHTNRWFNTMINQPNVKAVIGEFNMCTKMAQFDGKKFAEMQKSASAGSTKAAKAEKKQHEPQPKKQKEAKKEEKKEDEADEMDEFAEKPSKDPFAHLPKGTLNMDEWKKVYSNNDTKTVALPWFFENFDKENFSVWFCDYKYPEELSLIFMSCNLVTGMFQRLDKMRKHAFGSMCVFGEGKSTGISGLWFWRGHDLAFKLSEDLMIDYDSYQWTKLDFDKEETKKLIREYFSWEGDFGGRKFNQGKIFK